MVNTNLEVGGNTANYISCEEGCFIYEETLTRQYTETPDDGLVYVSVPANQQGRVYGGQTRTFNMPLGPDQPTICPVEQQGSVTFTHINGSYNYGLTATGSLSGGAGNGRIRADYTFPYPIDLWVQTHSLNGNEFIIMRSNVDEFYRLTNNVNRVSGQNYNNLTMADSNSSSNGPAMWHRQVTGFSIEIDGQSGLYSAFSWGIAKCLYLVPIQCRVSPENLLTTPCGAGTRPQTMQMIARKNVGPDFFAEKPLSQTSAAWEFSSDAGVTWGPAPATHNTVATAHNNRWRQVYTVPEGYEGWFRMAVRGGMDSTNLGGEFWHDGALLNAQRIRVYNAQPYGGEYQDTSYYVPVTAGVHTFEFREPAGAGAADIQLIADYRGVEVERRGFLRYSCVDGAGVQVGTAIDTNYDGTTFVPRVDEEYIEGVY